ncbi:hypothetical protein EJP82_26820 [Paenibacillus anaericanus]|uniref:Flp pilus assembly protein CpaB n=1 Tax=Paenibacillus anaericanus TaxID=170367 RepID=A0A3S1BCY5_9BACL|nr:hypothetical protein [Paenibacillus anaericanus]RUT38688.1 hypothetical protein EJP82_26820 [Paenibacillus anaericanus]
MKGRIWNKTTRRISVILGALIITLAVVLLSNSYVQKNTDLVKVVVAVENIQPDQSVNNKITIKEKVRSEIPEDAITDLKELENETWFANEIGFYKDEPIRKSGLTTSDNSKYGGALKLKDGDSLVGVKVDQAQSAGDYIKPGVIVDAVVYVKNEFETKVIGPKDDPDLAGLIIRDRQNAEGTEPGADGRSLITAVAIIETSNEQVKKKLVEYQEEGKIYLTPTGVVKEE